MTTGPKPPPPRRNYRQMVRVVREGNSAASGPLDAPGAVPYRMAEAYGEGEATPTQTRERSLDELGIDSRTSRRPEAPATDNYLPQREATTLYHQISHDQQLYFDGSSPDRAPTRSAAWPGTKTRTYLDSDAQAQGITPTPPSRGGHGTLSPPDNGGQRAATSTSEANGERNSESNRAQHAGNGSGSEKPGKPSPRHIPTPMPPAPEIRKQTRLPIVGQPSLEGTQGTAVDFDLRVSKPQPTKAQPVKPATTKPD